MGVTHHIVHAVPEAPITARARKAAQAANAQGQQSVSPAGKNVTAKGQPKQKQPNKKPPGKPVGQSAEAQNGAAKQQQAGPGAGKANGAKKQNTNPNQRKNPKQNQQSRPGGPAAAKTNTQAQKKEPVAV